MTYRFLQNFTDPATSIDEITEHRLPLSIRASEINIIPSSSEVEVVCLRGRISGRQADSKSH